MKTKELILFESLTYQLLINKFNERLDLISRTPRSNRKSSKNIAKRGNYKNKEKSVSVRLSQDDFVWKINKVDSKNQDKNVRFNVEEDKESIFAPQEVPRNRSESHKIRLMSGHLNEDTKGAKYSNSKFRKILIFLFMYRKYYAKII